MTLRSREQDRAHTALTSVERIRSDTKRKGFYQNRAQELPGMIQNLGLATTVAFLLSKGDGASTLDKTLADHLAAWLLDSDAGIAWSSSALQANKAGRFPGDSHRLQALISWQSVDGNDATSWIVYQQAQREAQRFAMWLKRWSKAGMA